MKKNRKFLSLFLSVLSCATLVSCGEGNNTSAPSNTGTVTTPSTPSAPSTPSTPSAPSSKPSTDENNSSKNEDEKKIYTIAELIAMMPSDGVPQLKDTMLELKSNLSMMLVLVL